MLKSAGVDGSSAHMLKSAGVDGSSAHMLKSAGVDGSSAHMLKLSTPCFAHIITDMCNLSITINKFPEEWKTGVVTSHFEKGSAEDPGNYHEYRAIYTLAFRSKLSERHTLFVCHVNFWTAWLQIKTFLWKCFSSTCFLMNGCFYT